MPDFMLENMNPDSLQPPLALFWRSALFDEVTALEDRLLADASLPRSQPHIADDDWDAIMSGFLQSIPSDATGSDAARLPPGLQKSAARAFHWRLRQAQNALGPLPLPGSAAYPPGGVLPSHAVLLPMLARARLGLLLGCAELPMVWIRSIDLARQKVPQQRPKRPE